MVGPPQNENTAAAGFGCDSAGECLVSLSATASSRCFGIPSAGHTSQAYSFVSLAGGIRLCA
jgi:hypothetical protein